MSARDSSAYANDGRVVWAEDGNSLTIPDPIDGGAWTVNVWDDGLARAYDQQGAYFGQVSHQPIDQTVAGIIGAPA